MYSFPWMHRFFSYGLIEEDNSRREDSQDQHPAWSPDHLVTLGFILRETRNFERVLKPGRGICSVYPFDKGPLWLLGEE